VIKNNYQGFWIAPGIPESAAGVLHIIRYARELVDVFIKQIISTKNLYEQVFGILPLLARKR